MISLLWHDVKELTSLNWHVNWWTTHIWISWWLNMAVLMVHVIQCRKFAICHVNFHVTCTMYLIFVMSSVTTICHLICQCHLTSFKSTLTCHLSPAIYYPRVTVISRQPEYFSNTCVKKLFILYYKIYVMVDRNKLTNTIWVFFITAIYKFFGDIKNVSTLTNIKKFRIFFSTITLSYDEYCVEIWAFSNHLYLLISQCINLDWMPH